MSKRTAGLLIGIGAGIGLACVIINRLRAGGDQTADIIIEPGTGGGPPIVDVTPEVTVKRNKHVRWLVDNRTQQDALVSLADWQDRSHRPVEAAVAAAADDNEQPPQENLSRRVPAGRRRQIRGRARGPRMALVESVKYSVYLDSALAVDPIVKLVL
jgi:hypothetical protein